MNHSSETDIFNESVDPHPVLEMKCRYSRCSVKIGFWGREGWGYGQHVRSASM